MIIFSLPIKLYIAFIISLCIRQYIKIENMSFDWFCCVCVCLAAPTSAGNFEAYVSQHQRDRVPPLWRNWNSVSVGFGVLRQVWRMKHEYCDKWNTTSTTGDVYCYCLRSMCNITVWTLYLVIYCTQFLSILTMKELSQPMNYTSYKQLLGWYNGMW